MKNLILKIDEELHKQIKIRATENGQTIKGYITTLIKRDLGIKNRELSAKTILSIKPSRQMHFNIICLEIQLKRKR